MKRCLLNSVHKADLTGVEPRIPVSIERKSLATALGITKVKAEEFKVSRGLAKQLQRLSEKQFGSHEDEGVRIEDAYKKGLHREPTFLALGLRGLVRRDAGFIKFCCSLKVL